MRVRAGFAGMAEDDMHGAVHQRDFDDVVVVLLVGDQRLAAGLDEGVVVVEEAPSRGAVGGGGVFVDDLTLAVDDQDAVVAAIGDQQIAGHARAPRGRQVGGGCARLWCRRTLRGAHSAARPPNATRRQWAAGDARPAERCRPAPRRRGRTAKGAPRRREDEAIGRFVVGAGDGDHDDQSDDERDGIANSWRRRERACRAAIATAPALAQAQPRAGDVVGDRRP